jgi:Holliday junction resolvase RusA-like endonuclease
MVEQVFLVEEVELVRTSSNKIEAISFVVLGDPPVQLRPKIAYRTRAKPVYYDPSSSEKRLWASLVREAIMKTENIDFPVFHDCLTTKGLSLTVEFHMKRQQLDFKKKRGQLILKDECQLYPGVKDINNMIKFVMDSLHDILYVDDKIIVKVVSQKLFTKDDECISKKNGFTVIKICLM